MAGLSRVEQYRPLALAIAREYFLPGADHDDVRQEAMIALAIADRDYAPERWSFSSFARLVIHRRLNSAVKIATRKKHRMLSEADRLHVSTNESREVDPGSWSLDPAHIVEKREEAFELLRRIDGLSPLQKKCLIASLNGLSHEEIAKEVGGRHILYRGGKKRYPRVYNALHCAKAKMTE